MGHPGTARRVLSHTFAALGAHQFLLRPTLRHSSSLSHGMRDSDAPYCHRAHVPDVKPPLLTDTGN